MAEKLTFESINNGDVLPHVKHTATQETLWHHAVATLDYNPVHVAPDWVKTAQPFGIPETVQHGLQTHALLGKVLTDWYTPVGGRMKSFSAKLVKPVPVGTTCTYGAVVTEIHPRGKDPFVRLDLYAENQDGQTIAVGWAEVIIPQ